MGRPVTATSVRALLAAGRNSEALEQARRGHLEHPDDSEWLHLLGLALHAGGASAEALPHLERSARLAQRNPLAWNAYGAVALELGRIDDARQALDEAIRLDPGYLEARFNAALLLRRTGEGKRAREALAKILQSAPAFAPAQLELSLLLLEAGDAREASRLLGELATRFPTDARVLVNASAACVAIGDAARALNLARAALKTGAVGPRERSALAHTLRELGDAPALRWLGADRLEAGDAAAAADALRESLRIDPASRIAWQQLAVALRDLGERREARAVLAEAMERGHRDAGLLAALAYMKGLDCDWQGLDTLVAEVRERSREPSEWPAHPQVSLYLPEVGAAEQLVWAKHWAAVQFRDRAPARRSPHREDGSRIRIGYLSRDFYSHATAALVAAMLEHHDRARFEVVAYSFGPNDGSPLRKRIERAFDRFVEIGALSNPVAAQRIADDGIDVLVDLGGYVMGSRMEILAHRPAPAQVHFLGYPGTTGAACVDYLVADPVIVPNGAEGHYTETILRMPVCYQPNDPRRTLPGTTPRAALGLRDDAFVLCSFNQANKLHPAVFGEWCRLLAAIPRACLWLLDPGAEARGHLAAFARERGVEPERIVFAPPVTQVEHIARLRSADLALDTFPYGSHTTASDAVWAAVPLVAIRGETFASRVSASVLAAAGGSDLVCADPASAFELALALANEPARLQRLRERLEAGRADHPLFDAARFTRDFEALVVRAAAGKGLAAQVRGH